ncbi:hypothetical protein E4634_21210 [Mangrovimicrobium sediminis]|uniref:Uncharacterized protein n=1 Tax=Mangrovimicrobium sediminis TaxID=2562682 RepID=A0A4Z0LT18_9GAMM|nr:hypothetical protein [Haliea sp. SAOS-164]TGD70298.1 hypothetical protein E4634_21210 [Haliea sp. SAOS-164]
MSEFDRALTQLQEIQSRIVESTRFRGIGADLNLATAGVVAVLALAQGIWPRVLLSSDLTYVAIWSLVLVISCVLACFDESRMPPTACKKKR